MYTYVELFAYYVLGISLEFVRFSYEVDENSGQAQPALRLDGPIKCCPVSITVKVEDITAKSKYYACVYI